MKLKAEFISKIGGRKENQDYCAIAEASGYGIYLVADGLGGHGGGALASKAAGEGITKAFTDCPGFSQEKLAGYLEAGRLNFNNAVSGQVKHKAPRTTLVALLTDRKSAIWVHLGDSRLYHIRRSDIIFQSKDHSVPGQLLSSGEISPEQVRNHEDRNRLTRAFDGDSAMRFEYNRDPVTLESGDAFLLCTDGFWEFVYEEEMVSDLNHAGHDPGRWLSLMEKRLLGRIPEGTDNYSALALVAG